MYPRNVTALLLEDARYFPVLGIIGPRQSGKTTLAKALRPLLGKETLYFDLELSDDARLLEQPSRFFQQNADKCIIIDEVQRMPELFTLLRAIVDQQRDPARFILLGSASPWLLRHSSESLAGRIAYTELTPFSLVELPADISMEKHWFRGGFPDALLAPSDTVCERWLDNLVKTFVERDVRLLGYELAPAALSRLILVLATVHGNLLNVSDLSRTLGISQPTVKHYLDILEGAFMIDRLQPYFLNITKRLVKSPKLYIRDSGILHFLANIPSAETLPNHILAGASWEGYVIEQIRRCTFQRWQYYFYRTQKGTEADLLLVSPGGKKILVEVKFTSAPVLPKGFFEAKSDIQPDFTYIITPHGHNYQRDDGIHILPLTDFLNQELPKLH
ncbi:MAG: ATP-binding protein [Bacteroidia bacterium]|nr:ATP-binding protein [Bacteroidia bacterium]